MEGGFAPYGYQLINGELHIAEDDAEIVRIIYDKFTGTTMGIATIAAFINNVGTRNEYHIVKQDNYMLSDGIHDRIEEIETLIEEVKPDCIILGRRKYPATMYTSSYYTLISYMTDLRIV